MFYSDELQREDVDINITNQNTNFNENMNTNMNMNEMTNYNIPLQQPNTMTPIIEPGRERVINRTFIHDVPQETLFLIENKKEEIE